MVCRSTNLSFLRLLRWTILVPLVIYVSLVIVLYKKNLSLKSPSSLNDNKKDKEGSETIESLFFELEGVTFDKKQQDNYKKTGEESIRSVKEFDIIGDPIGQLEGIFRRVDVNENQLLDLRELAKWIHAMITGHVSRGLRQNADLFAAVDNNPKNGEVSWEEYQAHVERVHNETSRRLNESIMKDKARWSKAARNDPDKLTIDEFLVFTHPESSHRLLLRMVEDLFEKFDRDGDEQLTEDEFSDIPSDNVQWEIHEEYRTMGGSADRRKEFRHLIDRDKNGRADRTELLMYIDPRNPRHAIQEAQHLINASDTNLDGKLNLSEVLSKLDLFLCVQFFDAGKRFHDEFR